MSKYIIYADEAWVQTDPLYRYHCFFGGFISTNDEFEKIANKVKELKKKHNYKKEIKWTNCSKKYSGFYNELIGEVEFFLDTFTETKYRQSFMDRVFEYTGEPCSHTDMQFKLYYQFIKHCFGIHHLNSCIDITIRLDEHSSQDNKQRLISYIQSLSLSDERIRYRVEFVDSKKAIPLQLCDLFMGAAGYYGNKLYNDRKNGAKRISKNQIAKKDLCKRIYNVLKAIDGKHRGSKAFNWFETTGVEGGNISARFHHKIRIWKFKPANHIVNKDWENDNFKANESRVRYLK